MKLLPRCSDGRSGLGGAACADAPANSPLVRFDSSGDRSSVRIPSEGLIRPGAIATASISAPIRLSASATGVARSASLSGSIVRGRLAVSAARPKAPRTLAYPAAPAASSMMSIRPHAATIYLSTSREGCKLRVDDDRLISSLGTFTRFKAPFLKSL